MSFPANDILVALCECALVLPTEFNGYDPYKNLSTYLPRILSITLYPPG